MEQYDHQSMVSSILLSIVSVALRRRLKSWRIAFPDRDGWQVSKLLGLSPTKPRLLGRELVWKVIEGFSILIWVRKNVIKLDCERDERSEIVIEVENVAGDQQQQTKSNQYCWIFEFYMEKYFKKLLFRFTYIIY